MGQRFGEGRVVVSVLRSWEGGGKGIVLFMDRRQGEVMRVEFSGNVDVAVGVEPAGELQVSLEVQILRIVKSPPTLSPWYLR